MTENSYPVELTAPDIEPYRTGNTGVEFVTTFDRSSKIDRGDPGQACERW